MKKETLQLLLVTVALFAIGGAVTLAYREHLSKLPTPRLQINKVVQLSIKPEPDCGKFKPPAKVNLYVQGMDTGLSAIGCKEDDLTASFLLRHSKNNQLSKENDEAVWSVITGAPLNTVTTGREIAYDLRLVADNQVDPIKTAEHKATLRIFKSWAPLVVAFVIWVWFLLIYLGARTALLRDPALPDTPLEKRTFSLAKTQMTWWFAIIFASFVFLWLVTGETPSLSPQALMLLGISTVTTIASNTVSGAQTSDSGDRGKFFIDLLSDDNGIAIHRFQMLVMTVTLGLLFLQDVVSTLIMPEFDGSLLTLMGISAGTYVALKIPTPPASGASPAPAPAPTPAAAPTPTPSPVAGPAPAAVAEIDPRSAYTPTT